MLQKLIDQFDSLSIDTESLDSELAQRLIGLFPEHKIRKMDPEALKEERGTMSAEEFNRSKRRLVVKPFRGHFFKRCPGATQKKALTCCNYYVLNLGSQCHFNCSYCYLQSYLNNRSTVIYSNIDQAVNELAEMARLRPELPVRVGTGEVIDSLGLDPLTLYSRRLIETMREFPNWQVEFKTKSNYVEQFLDCQHAGNIVVSWSLNPQFVIENEEHGTASLAERLLAAKKCKERDFPLAFHIDPMIYFVGWQDHYRDLVKQITSQFKPADVKVISMGTLRFQPEQRFLMRERFGFSSLVNQSEMFPSEGGKMRFDAGLRTQMFSTVRDAFKSHSKDWNIFLCMETPETWISVYDKTPMQVNGLKEYFRPLPHLEGRT